VNPPASCVGNVEGSQENYATFLAMHDSRPKQIVKSLFIANEIAETMASVQLEDVPQDGTPAYLDQRFRPKFSFLAHARAVTAAEDHHLHVV
jgi:hypothetical protein